VFYRITLRSKCGYTPGRAANPVAECRIVWAAHNSCDFRFVSAQSTTAESEGLQVVDNDQATAPIRGGIGYDC
jgi:hypothetical protein